MKFHTLAALTCAGLLATTNIYADEPGNDGNIGNGGVPNQMPNQMQNQATDNNQTLADNTSTNLLDSGNTSDANQTDTLASNPRTNDNLAPMDMSQSQAMNTGPTDIAGTGNSSSGSNELSPDTATGDDY